MKRLLLPLAFLCGACAGPGAPTALIITTATLPPAKIGVEYSTQLTAAGGAAPYLWSADTLPPALTLSPSRLLSGPPTTPGTYTFTVRVVDSTRLAQTVTIQMEGTA